MKASVSEKNTGLLVRWFEDVGMHDVGSVGGKNASLGEMIQHLESQGIQVPGGFATTAEAYRRFVRENGLEEQIGSILESWRQGATALDAAGRKIRRLFVRSEFSEELSSAIVGSYTSCVSATVMRKLTWRFAAARPPKIYRTRVLPVSRRPF